VTARPRILFGGSFDPPQRAHRELIDAALTAFPGAELIVIPAGSPPNKLGIELTPLAQRITMCELAFAAIGGVTVSDEDSGHPGPSYTYETVARHRAELGPTAELYWLLGSDSLLDLPNWRRPDAILARCKVLTVARPGFDPSQVDELAAFSPEQREQLKNGILPAVASPVSSTEARRRIAAGEDASALLAPEVLEFVLANGLYA